MRLDDQVNALVDAVHDQIVDQAGGERAAVAQIARARAPLASAAVVDAVVDRVLARTVGLGPLEPLLVDGDVTEVMVNGPGPVWIERGGAIEATDVRLDRAAIELLVERIVAPLGLRADRTSPLVDARLPDGSRVNVIIPPLAIDGPCITIRRFGAIAIPLRALCGAEVAALLERSVRDRANIVVSGGTGAGKTTLLNALAAAIPDDERIVTVEDAAELRLPGRHVVRLEARPANADGVGAVPVRALVRNALRMRPDRIVVGETRGAEALDMLQAMNTGHEGSLSTCHANSPVDALRRIETMVMMGDVGLPLGAIREQLVSALDLVVHVVRRPDGSRGVAAVSEVTNDSARVRLLADAREVVASPERPARR
ncbi:MAG: pilus assembly protein CpaF [Acidimicrobiaceae bacterium]